MEKIFSKHWNSSKQPRKQRKYLANAPLHLRNSFVSSNLSKDLREKHLKRSLPLRKNDIVKVMKGKFKGKKGKVLNIDLKESMIEVEGLHVQKKDGSKANVKMRPSNLQITEISGEDKKRNKSKETNKSQKQEK